MVRPQYRWFFLKARETFHFSQLPSPLLSPNRLYVRELANPVRAQFAAHPRALHPAKRDPGVGKHHLIDEDHAGFEFTHEAFLLALVVRPGAGSEAEPGIIRHANCFI